MVKRIKTPEPGDDEPKYFTVVHPYPSDWNWEDSVVQASCARWLAGVLGTDAPIYGIFHKPSSRGMILIEIERTFDAKIVREHLLGEHKWSEFLLNPSEDEKKRVTQIFFSFYTNGREAQKDGWKRVHVEDKFFDKWRLHNSSVIRQPYPKTSWCPVPQEDVTNKALCRPLPRDPNAPKPAPAPRQVPGSAAWVDNKTGAQPALQGAWAKKNAAKSSAKQQPVTTSKPAPRPEANAPPKSAWTQPISVTKSKSAPAGGAAAPGLSLNNPNAWASPSPSVPLSPPGLGPPPGLTRDASGSSQGMPATPSGLSSPSLSHLTDNFSGLTMSESQEADLYGLDRSPDINGAGYVAEYELGGYRYPVDDFDPPSNDFKTDNGVENLWSDVVIKPTPQAKDEVVCPVHTGKQCKKGICAAYADELRKREREKKGRNGNGANGGGKGARNANANNGNGEWKSATGKKRGRATANGGVARSQSGSSPDGSAVRGVVDEDDPWK